MPDADETADANFLPSEVAERRIRREDRLGGNTSQIGIGMRDWVGP